MWLVLVLASDRRRPPSPALVAEGRRRLLTPDPGHEAAR